MQVDEGGAVHLNWIIDTRILPTRGLDGTFTATPQDCEAVARFLSLTALCSFTMSYSASAAGEGRFRFRGRLDAAVVQPCVITQDPVEGIVSEPFDVCFCPGIDDEADAFAELGLDADEPEPLKNGKIDAGAFALELLSVSIDPYPRSAGARFDDAEATRLGAPRSPAAGPFAALEKLRKAP